MEKPRSKKKRIQKKFIKKLCVELGIFESTNLWKEKAKAKRIYESDPQFIKVNPVFWMSIWNNNWFWIIYNSCI